MPLDPALTPVLKGLEAQGFTTFEALGVDGARAAMSGFSDFQRPGGEVEQIADAAYGPDPDHRLRVYVPSTSKPLPVVVYYHGGGYIGCDLPLVDGIARDLSRDLGAVVVTVTYRKAPEHAFPAAPDDAWAALEWVVENVADHGGDPARIAVAGDSAGGTLAMAVAVRAGQQLSPGLAGVVLFYPFIDPWAETPSRDEFATGYVLAASDCRWFGSLVTGSPADRTDPRLAVNRTAAADLARVPPTLIITNEYDPLRDEAESFADQLRSAGGSVEVERLAGLVHAAYWLTAVVPRSRAYHDRAVQFLAHRFTQDPVASST